MGNWVTTESPPPVVLVPPVFDQPQLVSRSRMVKSSYDVLFSKVSRERLFADYYGEAERFMAQIMLKPPEDPNVDFIATVATPLEEGKKKLEGDAVFRWQRNAVDPNTFVELKMSTSKKALEVQACTFDADTGLGAFATFPVISKTRFKAENNHLVGIRYGSSKLSVGTIVNPLFTDNLNFWLVGRLGKITAGCQYKPHEFGVTKDCIEYQVTAMRNPRNWSFAVDYGSGRSGPLNPSFNFCFEVDKYSKLIASYYHHLVVQRRVKNPFEETEVVAITNYIDFGFEFQQSLEESKTRTDELGNELLTMQIGASWQANKNLLLKAKVGNASSGVALIFKSWWQPSFTVSYAVTRHHMLKRTKFGLGVRIENFGGVSYERADPNYVMLTPTKEHLAEGVLKHLKERPMLKTDVTSGNVEAIPPELRPFDTIL